MVINIMHINQPLESNYKVVVIIFIIIVIKRRSDQQMVRDAAPKTIYMLTVFMNSSHILVPN